MFPDFDRFSQPRTHCSFILVVPFLGEGATDIDSKRAVAEFGGGGAKSQWPSLITASA
jgi:hypothetical protein